MKVERRIQYFELDERKILKIMLSYDVFTKVHSTNLPEDTQLMGVYHDHMKGVFQFVIHSKTFEKVAIGVEPPRFEISYEMMEYNPAEGNKDAKQNLEDQG